MRAKKAGSIHAVKRLWFLKLILLIAVQVIASHHLFAQDFYRQREDMYQHDADIVRMKHFDYYARLLTEYYSRNGKYPFQNEKDVPVYVFILTSFQEQRFEDTNPYRHYTIRDTQFFEELSRGLGRKIPERYDPQKVSGDSRPTMYIYMVEGDSFYFAVHLYNANPFTKYVGEYYYKLELSNTDDEKNNFFTYGTLRKNPEYLDIIKGEPQNSLFFYALAGQYQDDSKYSSDTAALKKRENAFNYYTEALSWLYKNNLTRAMTEIDKAIALNQDESDYYRLKGDLLFEQGKSEEARDYFEKALSISGGNAAAYDGLGFYYYEIRNDDEAIRNWVACVSLDPENKNALYGLVMIYREMGDESSASVYINMLKELNVEMD